MRNIIVLCIFISLFGGVTYAQHQVDQVAQGVFKVTEGKIDEFTPEKFRNEEPALKALSDLSEAKLPFDISEISIKINQRGCQVAIPLGENEQLYGFGLQIGSFNQNGLRKVPVVNDYPLNNLGYTHAPLPYYVSNKGYAILVNTARYVTFYCGGNQPKGKIQAQDEVEKKGTRLTVEELYNTKVSGRNNVLVDLPGAEGIEIYVFAGPDMKAAIQRYNLFAGGGAIPPIWGLGVKYRVKADFKQPEVIETANYFRKNNIPISVLGLEPRWQTAAYPCSFDWDKEFFPDPKKMIKELKSKGFELNLWEHAFVSPKSPIYKPLHSHSGNFLAFQGLVPDFADKEARKIFADYHRDSLVDMGVSGFKMDESDNSDLTRGDGRWSFPEFSEFPSGIDGEKMHQLFGLLYQKTIFNIFKERNQRTYLDVRSSNAFSSPFASVLYSDIYGHKDYVEMIANSGFSGLLWSPEVRESRSFTDLAMRTQSTVLSAQTLFNSWYLQHPPWLQFDRGKNNDGELLAEASENEKVIKSLLDQRISLIPYLYMAFHEYNAKGVPPFRALVTDYPEDKNTFTLADQYMIGPSLLAAPFYNEQKVRKVYLPKGDWYDYNTFEKLEGGKTHEINFEATKLPLFVKAGTILPLASPVSEVTGNTVFTLNCLVFGQNPGPAYLFEDDGITFNYAKGQYNHIKLSSKNKRVQLERTGNFKGKKYTLGSFKYIK